MTRRHHLSRPQIVPIGQPSSSDIVALSLQRGIDAVVWGTPIVSFDAMRTAFLRDAGARYGDIVYLSKPADPLFRITTPNASSHYVYFNFNTADGPVIFEVPPAEGAGLFGSILDAWQVPIADVGPQGEDRGRGATYVLLPPGDHTTVVSNAIAVPMTTFNGYIALRAIPEDSSADALVRALELVKHLRTYPMRSGAPPQQRFIDMSGKLFDGIVRYDESFFDGLARMLGEEPVLARDADYMADLAMLGIVKGRPFQPDAATRTLLADAARAARAQYTRALPDDGSLFWQGRRWRGANTVGAQTHFTFVTDAGLDVRSRGLIFFLACAPPAKLGKATAYLATYVDGTGSPLTGDHTYRLHVPAHVPAKQFWAATVYDLSTAAFIRGAPRVEVNSYDKQLQFNPDGSLDLYFGPKPPAGRDANWAYTEPGTRWFMFFRFYGPTEALADRSWQLPDLQIVNELEVRNEPTDKHGWIATETVHSRVGNLAFEGGYPTPAAIEKLYRQQQFHRAVEVYLSQLPAVSMVAIEKGLAAAGADSANKLVIFETLMDSQTLLLTGNTETVYAMGMLDLHRDGPTVLEIPPTVLGGAMDMWQRSLVDMGSPGPDRGHGGKYLFLPPDHRGPVPSGYFVVPSRTNGVFYGVRGFLIDGKPDHAVALLRSLKAYPLEHGEHAAEMVYLDGSGKPIDTIFPDTYTFFEHLAALVEREPIDALPPTDRFYLASIGIEKGKPFEPSSATRSLLAEAARVGGAMARTLTYASRDPAALVYPDRRWQWAFVGGSSTFDSQGYVNPDRRTATYYAAIGNSPAMVLKVVGGGSQYLWTPRDVHGHYLDGGTHYRLRLPPRIPAERFWSVVVYDAISRSELQTGQRLPGISQYTGPVVNADGSVDIYFGPTAPPGKERNWIQTVPGRGWFPYLRIYSPAREFFEQSWKPDDIVPENDSDLAT